MTDTAEPEFEDPFDTGDVDYAKAQEDLVEYNRLLNDSSAGLDGMDRLLDMDGPEIDYIASLDQGEEEGGEEVAEEPSEEEGGEEDVEEDVEADLFTNDTTPTEDELRNV